jgi:hypothetical protein
MKRVVFLIAIFTAVILSPGFSTDCLAGRYCEVVSFSPYESPGIVTENGMLVQMIRRCADVTIRNTDNRSRYVTDYDLTAFYENGDRSSKSIDREEDRLKSIEPGQTYTTSACFGHSDSPIVRVDCGY